jgi:hypothetical protein
MGDPPGAAFAGRCGPIIAAARGRRNRPAPSHPGGVKRGGVRPEELKRLAEVQPEADRQVRIGFDRLPDEPPQVFRQRV